MRDFRPLGRVEYLSGILCCFSFFSRTSGTGVPFGSFSNFVFMDFSQSHGCVDRIYGCAGSCVRYKYIVISFICGHAGDLFFDIIYKIIVCFCFI